MKYNYLNNEIVLREFLETGAPNVIKTDKVRRVYTKNSVIFEFEHKKASKTLKTFSNLQEEMRDLKPTKFTLTFDRMNLLFKQQIRIKKFERILSKSNMMRKLEVALEKYK